jgi:hypothetical protein
MNETTRESKKLNEDRHDEIINDVNKIRQENKHLSASIEAMEVIIILLCLALMITTI